MDGLICVGLDKGTRNHRAPTDGHCDHTGDRRDAGTQVGGALRFIHVATGRQTLANAMDAARSAARVARDSALETAQAVAPAGSGVAQVLPKADPIDLAEVRAKGETTRGDPGPIRPPA